ncbi:MAG: DNA adenine methylase [Flexilinea sp.]|nr:DNA adenine methylase [Flexilinea sp.]
MIHPVIKWSGSKRPQAELIKKYAPDFDCYYEPFIGGGSILYALSPKKAVCGDICKPLIQLWNEIKDNPIELSKAYRSRWNRLQNEGHAVYYEIRDHFNRTQSPEDLLFLSRTCVNGLIRFNSKGEFNNAFHHTRPGIHPDTLETIINDWSLHIKGARFLAEDYRITTESATQRDFVYLDPPYFHTAGMYYGAINYRELLDYLYDLNRRGIKFMLSYDGKSGDIDHTVEIPEDIYKRHIYADTGLSPFKKVMDKDKQQVYESLYMNY